MKIRREKERKKERDRKREIERERERERESVEGGGEEKREKESHIRKIDESFIAKDESAACSRWSSHLTCIS